MKKLWLGLLAGVLLAGFGAGTAHADVNDFTITQFDAEYTLSRDDPQGELKVKETIAVNFSDQNHGIVRALPNTYKKHSLGLEIDATQRDNNDEPWSSYQSNGNTVLKIGDPNHTITGAHTYVIQYAVHNVISFYKDHDELYWDINGDQWRQTAEHVSVVVRLPGGVEQQRDPICYTGSFGSTEHACLAGYNNFTNVLFAESTRPLQAGETLSLVAGFKKDYFYPPTWSERATQTIATILKFLVPFALLAGTAGWQWYRYGRDPKGRSTIVPEYEPPDGLTPIEVGTVADFRTDNRDITATVIDLAIRRFVTIIESNKPHFLRKDTKLYSLRLENTDVSTLNEFEKTLLQGIFAKQEKGEEVDLDMLKYKLSSTASTLQRSVKASLVAQGYFHKTPLSAVLRFTGLLFLELIVVIVWAVLFSGAAATLGVVAGVAAAVIFIILLPSRTEKGVAAKDSILGLKMYLEVAEAERIKKLQSPDAPYAPKSAGPKQTVKLFEKLLPYAMVLGVEEQWAKQFEALYRTPPDWYQGNWTTFNVLYLTSALNSGLAPSINQTFSSPSSSSSSGFSGGGAGGGGGGGGGGGW